MPEQDRIDNRPSCGYKVKQADGSRKPCGSEDKLYNVSGNSRTWNQPRNTPVCGKHLPDAIRDWSYKEVTPIDYTGPKTNLGVDRMAVQAETELETVDEWLFRALERFSQEME
jgi:hypothetical protein